jgi:hypothetical protein
MEIFRRGHHGNAEGWPSDPASRNSDMSVNIEHWGHPEDGSALAQGSWPFRHNTGPSGLATANEFRDATRSVSVGSGAKTLGRELFQRA